MSVVASKFVKKLLVTMMILNDINLLAELLIIAKK